MSYLKRQGPDTRPELLRLPGVGHIRAHRPGRARLPGGPRCGGPVGRVVGSPACPRPHHVRRAAAHRDRQGRHRQDDRRRGDGHGPRVRRPPGPARRGRGPPGHQPDLRRAAAGHRGDPDRRRRRRRRGRGPVGRRQGRAARVPADLLQARPGRRGAERFGAIDFATTIAPGVRDVLLIGKVYEANRRRRDGQHAADAPRPTTRSSSTPRRPAASCGSSSQRGGRRPRQGRADPVPGRLDHPDAARRRRPPSTSSPCSRRCRCRRPSTPSADLRAAGLPVGRHRRQPGARAAARADELASAAKGAAAAGPRSRAGLAAAGLRVTDALVDGLLDEAARPRRSASPRARAARAARRSSGCRSSELPVLPAASTRRPVRELADLLRRRGWHRARGAAMSPRATPRAPRLDVDALLADPATEHRRLLRLRRRRQDHDGRRSRPAGGRAGSQGRRPHHRPGPPARPVARPHRARQHPPPGAPTSTRRPAARSTR